MLGGYDGVILLYTLTPLTILHELQHAYDDYRSLRKFIETKRFDKFVKLDRPENTLVASGVTTKEDIQNKLKKLRNTRVHWTNSYTRLPHEKSAFFVQTIKKTDFFIDEKKLILKDIRTVWEEFKHNYQNWFSLTPKMQKDVMRKFSQYYYKIKEQNIGDE